MFLWYVQEVAGLKIEDLPSDPPCTAADSSSTLSESHMYTSCDSIVIVCSAGSVSQTPPTTHSDPPVPSVDLSNIPDDGTLGESPSTPRPHIHHCLYHCRYSLSSCCTACSPEEHCVSMV